MTTDQRSELDQLQRLKADIDAHQKDPTMHPFTCGHDSRHRALDAFIEGREVVLVCLDCSYRQRLKLTP